MELWMWAVLAVGTPAVALVVWDLCRERPKKDPPRTDTIGLGGLEPSEEP